MKTTDVILDLGSYFTIYERSGSDNPISIPTIIADSNEPIIQRPYGRSLSKLNSERYYGTDALKYKNVLKITHFLRKNDFFTLAFYLQHLFENIGLDPKECGFIFIVPANFSHAKKQELQHVLFTTLNMPKIAFLPPAACVLTALGLDTGVIVDIGHNSTRIESIFKGFPRIESQFTYPMGGSHITSQLFKKMFKYKNYQSKAPFMEIVEQIKTEQNVVIVSEDILMTLQEIERGTKKYDFEVNLPDGTKITLNKERFLSAELFFQPELARLHSENLIAYIEQSIRAWDRSSVRELCRNVIICGGGSQIPGLAKRIRTLLEARFPASIKIEIRETGAASKSIFWKGANIIYQLRQGELGEWNLNPYKEDI